MIPGASFSNGSVTLGPYARLYVFSDGAYEVLRPDGSMMRRSELAEFLAASPCPDEVLEFARRQGASETLADDFSLLEVEFD
jgi:sigma-B regulation protein RsbU (phosphoserine phosphatase)